MAVTIKDIAKYAGVSITTVSRALNGYKDVNEDTREKIKRIAKKLNYTPNSLARGLVTNKTHTVGLVISELIKPGAYHPFFLEILAGIKAGLRNDKYDLILFTVDPSMQNTISYEKLCNNRKVEGAIVEGLKLSDPYIEEIKKTSIPTVIIDIPILNKNVGYVSSNNLEAAFEATSYLIKLGHKNIGFINGHNDAAVSYVRFEGYKRALEKNNIPYKDEYVIFDDFTQEGGYNNFRKMVFENPEITAVFHASDLMAIGSLKAAQDLGMKVPDDISIVGFDDIELSSLITPGLTTIRQENYKMGYMAAKHLISIINGATPKHVIIPHKLIIRQSARKI